MGALLGTLRGCCPSALKQEKTSVSQLRYCSALSQQGDRLQSADAKALWSWQYANYCGEGRSHLSHLPPVKGKRACLAPVILLIAHTTRCFWELQNRAIIDTTSNKPALEQIWALKGLCKMLNVFCRVPTTSIRTNSPWGCSSLSFMCPKKKCCLVFLPGRSSQ